MTNDAGYRLVAEQSYQRLAKKFLRKHPELRPAYERLLDDLVADPFAPALRLHQLEGTLRGKWAVSLTHAYRVVLTLKVVERRVNLLDIGGHDEVYR